MSSRAYLSSYSEYYAQKKVSVGEILEDITFLTKLGALCLLTGKIFMVVAIAAVFVPLLNGYAVTCTVIWGSLVFTSIVLCSVDHYLVQPKMKSSLSENNPATAAIDALMYTYTQSEIHDCLGVAEKEEDHQMLEV